MFPLILTHYLLLFACYENILAITIFKPWKIHFLSVIKIPAVIKIHSSQDWFKLFIHFLSTVHSIIPKSQLSPLLCSQQLLWFCYVLTTLAVASMTAIHSYSEVLFFSNFHITSLFVFGASTEIALSPFTGNLNQEWDPV